MKITPFPKIKDRRQDGAICNGYLFSFNHLGVCTVYKIEDLIGKQVLAVVNFPSRQIANFMSEVLVLGTYSKSGVVLIKPDKQVENGDKLG